MLQNAYFLAKIGADTAENEQHFAEILPIGRRVADHGPTDRRRVRAAVLPDAEAPAGQEPHHRRRRLGLRAGAWRGRGAEEGGE